MFTSYQILDKKLFKEEGLFWPTVPRDVVHGQVWQQEWPTDVADTCLPLSGPGSRERGMPAFTWLSPFQSGPPFHGMVLPTSG